MHGRYSPTLGRVSLKDAGLNEWKYDKKVGLRLEAKNIVADDGKEAVQITSYFNKQETAISGKRLQSGLTDKMEVYQVALQKTSLIQISKSFRVVKVREII